MNDPAVDAPTRDEILVIGSANMDLYTRLDHIPVGGETILGSPIWTSPGGKGANQAAAAGRLGAKVRFVGQVGRDEYGDRLRAGLAGAGVDVTGLRTGESPSSLAIILLTPDGENSIVVSPSSNQHVAPDDVDLAFASVPDGIGAVICQLEIPLETVIHTAEVAARNGVRFVLNAAPAQPLPAALLGSADPLVVNESEAALLLGPERAAGMDPEGLVQGLLGLGPASVVLTLGGDGVALGSTEGPVTQLPARKVPVVDTTGAGDAFVAALTSRLVAGDDLDTAAQYATIVGSLVVQKEGAQASYPTAFEVAAVDD